MPAAKYNALQLKVEKRFSQGLQFVSHYTWSSARFYDNNYFAIDPKVAYGPMNVNRNHVWVTNFIYDCRSARQKVHGRFQQAHGHCHRRMETDQYHQLDGGLPWTPQFGDCGQARMSAFAVPTSATGL